MHAHTCPGCRKDYNHERFVIKATWTSLEKFAARHLHRFYGACQSCIEKYLSQNELELLP